MGGVGRSVRNLAVLATLQVDNLPGVLGGLADLSSRIDGVASDVRVITAIEADCVLAKTQSHIHIILVLIVRAGDRRLA